MAKRLHLINYAGKLPVEIGGYGFFSYRDFDDTVADIILKSDLKHLVEIPLTADTLEAAGLGLDGQPLPVPEPVPEQEPETSPEISSDEVPDEVPQDEQPKKKSKKKE